MYHLGTGAIAPHFSLPHSAHCPLSDPNQGKDTKVPRLPGAKKSSRTQQVSLLEGGMSQSWGEYTAGMVGRPAYYGSLNNATCHPPLQTKSLKRQKPWMKVRDPEVPPCPRPKLSHTVYAQGPLMEERAWGTLELELDGQMESCPMGDPIKSTIHFFRAGLSSPCPLKEAMGPNKHPDR